LSRLERDKYKTLISCGVCLLSATGRSLRLEIHLPGSSSTQVYYIGLGDLENVLNGRKRTATIVKPAEV
jgi:hypothetical protein